MSWDPYQGYTDRRVLRGLVGIGQVVKCRRIQRGISQRELERLSGVDQTIICRLENGKLYNLRWARFARIVGALDGLDVSAPATERPAWPGPVTGGPPDPAALRAILEAQMARQAEAAEG